MFYIEYENTNTTNKEKSNPRIFKNRGHDFSKGGHVKLNQCQNCFNKTDYTLKCGICKSTNLVKLEVRN